MFRQREANNVHGRVFYGTRWESKRYSGCSVICHAVYIQFTGNLSTVKPFTVVVLYAVPG
jgi:hypothetical protein